MEEHATTEATAAVSATVDEDIEEGDLKEDDDLHLLALPDQVLQLIVSFLSLLKKAPFDDGLVHTCKKLTRIVYTHPNVLRGFHVRVDPFITQKWPRSQTLHIGLPNVSEAARRSIVVSGGSRTFRFDNNDDSNESDEDTLEDIKMEEEEEMGRFMGKSIYSDYRSIIKKTKKGETSSSVNTLFSLDKMTVFKCTRQCTVRVIQPIFDLYSRNIRYLSFLDCAFLNGDRKGFSRGTTADDGGIASEDPAARERRLQARRDFSEATGLASLLRQKSEVMRMRVASGAARDSELKQLASEKSVSTAVESSEHGGLISKKKTMDKLSKKKDERKGPEYEEEDSSDEYYDYAVLREVESEGFDIPQFPSVILFSLLIRRPLLRSISLDGKFPSLVQLALTIESDDRHDWNLIQELMDRNSNSLSVLQLSFNINNHGVKEENFFTKYRRLPEEPDDYFRLSVPQKVEILSLSVINSDMIRINCDRCRDSLVQLVFANHSLALMNEEFFNADKPSPKRLRYVVLNDTGDLHSLDWSVLVKYGLSEVYTPSLRSYAEGMSGDHIRCLGKWPEINHVRDCLANELASQMLRNHNNDIGRFRLYNLFWKEESDREDLKRSQRDIGDYP